MPKLLTWHSDVCIKTDYILFSHIIVALSLNKLFLIKWKDEQERLQKFRLINEVSAQWRKFGHRFSLDPNELDAWEKKLHHDSERCWSKVMHQWQLSGGTEEYPFTWEGLCVLLVDLQCPTVAEELKRAVRLAVIPPPPVEKATATHIAASAAHLQAISTV